MTVEIFHPKANAIFYFITCLISCFNLCNITSCSLSLDLMLKYTDAKIELIRNISIFDYVNSYILGGICIASQNIADDKNGIISPCDIASLYPHIMTKKLPIGNYRFIKYFNRNRYLNSDYFCLLIVRFILQMKLKRILY